MTDPNAPQWHIYDRKEQQGPLPEAEIHAGIRQGRYHRDCLVWREGLEQWQAITQTPEFAADFAAEIQQQPAPPPFSAVAPATAVVAAASPGRRFAAFLVDFLLIYLSERLMLDIGEALILEPAQREMPDVRESEDFLLVFSALFDWYLNYVQAMLPALSVIFLLLILLWLFRDALGGKSPGKLLLGLRVIHCETKRPIGPGLSIGRNFIFAISMFCCHLLLILEGIVLLASADSRRIGDRIANTRVIRE